jgi:CHAD domain-containing protein
MVLSESSIPIVNRFTAFSSLWSKARHKQSQAAIHNFRVAARRLLAALELAGTLAPLPKVEKLTRRIKKSLKASSELRDVAVQRGIVEKLEVDGGSKAFRKLLLDAERREVRQIEKKLTDKKRRKIRLGIHELERELQERLPAKDNDFVRKELEEATIRQSDSLLKKIQNRPHFTSNKALHRARIGLKRLRYMVEIVYPDWNVQKLRALQNRMGYVHDLSVLDARVLQWSKRDRSHDRDPITRLRSAIKKRRKQAVLGLNKALRSGILDNN